MLTFKDFLPRQLKPAGFLQGAEYGTFEDAARAAGNWMKSKGVQPIQIETVVLPNIHGPFEKGSADPELRADGDRDEWYQFLRVWYEAPDA